MSECKMSDQDMQDALKRRGYIVPVMVIRTWSKAHHTVHFSRLKVERWLTHENGVRYAGRRPKFPQFLAPFDTNILRKYQRLEEEARQIPRLERTHEHIERTF